MNFDFISDEAFRKILKRDYTELQLCHQSEAAKSVLIMSGSIIEAILVDYLINFKSENITESKVLGLELYALLELAAKEELISKSTKDLSTVLKNYRNLIHPGREIRKKEKFDNETANIAVSLLKIVINEIREKYYEQLGYTSADIFHKLENDSINIPTFERILKNLHKTEKKKLFKLLVGHYVNDDELLIENLPKYILALKDLIDRSTVEEHLTEMLAKVETGVQWEVMNRFELFSDDIHLLENDPKELLLLYVLNVLTDSTKDIDHLRTYSQKHLFSKIGQHLVTDSIKKEYLDCVCAVVNGYDKEHDFTSFSAYEQLIGSVDDEKAEKTKEYVLENAYGFRSEPFYKGYNDGDYLPF